MCTYNNKLTFIKDEFFHKTYITNKNDGEINKWLLCFISRKETMKYFALLELKLFKIILLKSSLLLSKLKELKNIGVLFFLKSALK